MLASVRPDDRGSTITIQGGVLKDSFLTNDGPDPKNPSEERQTRVRKNQRARPIRFYAFASRSRFPLRRDTRGNAAASALAGPQLMPQYLPFHIETPRPAASSQGGGKRVTYQCRTNAGLAARPRRLAQRLPGRPVPLSLTYFIQVAQLEGRKRKVFKVFPLVLWWARNGSLNFLPLHSTSTPPPSRRGHFLLSCEAVWQRKV